MICPYFHQHAETSFPKHMVEQYVDIVANYLRRRASTLIFLGANNGLPELCLSDLLTSQKGIRIHRVILVDYKVDDQSIQNIIELSRQFPFDVMYLKEPIGSPNFLSIMKHNSAIIGLNFAPVYNGRSIQDIMTQMSYIRKAFVKIQVLDLPLLCLNYREESKDVLVKKDFAKQYLEAMRKKRDESFFTRP